MSDRKSVDRLFQEKFKEFEATPPENSWTEIRERLPKKRRNKPLVFWWTTAAIVAVLLSIPLWNIGSENGPFMQNRQTQGPNDSNGDQITTAPGTDVTTPETAPQKPAETHEPNPAVTPPETRSETSRTTWASNSDGAVRTSGNNKRFTTKSDANKNPNATTGLAALPLGESPSENQPERRIGLTAPVSPKGTEAPTQTFTSPEWGVANQSTDTVNANAVVDSPGKLPNEKEVTASVPQGENAINRWQLQSRVAPVFMNAHGNESALDMNLAQADREYKTTVSVGVGVSYDLGNRWKIRTGVNALRLEYETRDLVFTQTREASTLQHGDMNEAGSLLHIGPNTPETDGGMQISNASKINGNLSHRTSYIEWPVELSYSVLDKRFGIDIIGGASALFLQKNDLVLVGDQTQMSIGRANNLSRTHFSTNLGIGLRYEIFKKIALSVEPTLKYQFNTYGADVDFNPYFFGVYSGLQYRF